MKSRITVLALGPEFGQRRAKVEPGERRAGAGRNRADPALPIHNGTLTQDYYLNLSVERF
jgi:hypothetical protein